MPLAVSITKIVAFGQDCTVYFNLTPSGSYTTGVGGDTVNFTTATQDTAFLGDAPQIPASLGPVSFSVWDSGGNILYGVYPSMGTTQANNKVKFSASGTFGTELGTGAYPAGLTGTKLQGVAVFHKNL